MESFEELNTGFLAFGVLITGTIFAAIWLLDSVKHGQIVETDITDQEIQTHRNILSSSLLMEVSLVTMYWFPWESLPFFIAFFITRTAHEFIDELHWHTDRCTPYESMLHLGMWTSVLSNTVLLFIWAFFTQFEGILDLPFLWYVWAFALLGTTAVISFIEWGRG